jgi:hypothetical protein
MDEGEVIDDVLAPAGEAASRRAPCGGVDRNSFGEVPQPTESVGTKHQCSSGHSSGFGWMLVTPPYVAIPMPRM